MDAPLRKVPVAWEALEDAFENNAPEVHSYLHMTTGDVIRVVDGVADPATHGRIAVDSSYLRVDPVSSREQYRWMERFIATVEEGPLRQKLLQSIDGKGAFRRFKDVLVAFPVDRERWFTFRSERLRTCMESWLEAQGVVAVERPEWQVPTADDVRPQLERPVERPHDSTERPVIRRTPMPPRPSGLEGQRKRAHDVIDSLSPRELEAALAYLEFMRDRARATAPAPAAPAPAAPPRELSLVAPAARIDRESLRDRDDDDDSDEP
ncbi:MAG: hypothetical protein JWN48_3272 [Myxococcaceae bacterium]|nr:hypothetical protein [Myxococcaceae bacterium]